MSAWLVSKQHIDVLVHALGVREMFPEGMGPDEVGALLWAENVESLQARYGNRHPDLYEGYVAYRYAPPVVEWSPSEVSAEIHCYDYQACEHSSWEDSTAYALVTRLNEVLEAAGADWQASGAPWGVPHCGHKHSEFEGCPEEVAS